MSRLTQILLAGAVIAVGLSVPKPIAFAEAQKPSASEPVQVAPAIRVVAATRQELVETLAVTGSVVPRQEAAVGVDVAGLIVRELNADKGDVVREGDVLARLDRVAMETQLAQLDATRAQIEANVAQAKAQAADAEVGVRQAAESLERAKALQDKGVASQSTLDSAVNSADSAKAKLETANKAIAAAEAQLGVNAAQRRDVEEKLARTEVKATADGLILARNATLGGIVSASGGALFRIAIDGDLELAGTVAETALAALKPGMPVKVTVAGAQTVEGRVRTIDPEIAVQTRLGTVRIALPADPGIRSGNFAHGTIETSRRNGLAVPAGAVLYKGSEAFVQKVVDGTVVTTVVTTGARAAGKVEILSGLAEGDEVVGRAGTFVADGDKVTPVRDEAIGAISQ